jgi:hypothetical protein
MDPTADGDASPTYPHQHIFEKCLVCIFLNILNLSKSTRRFKHPQRAKPGQGENALKLRPHRTKYTKFKQISKILQAFEHL